ncbi:hypothetical protein QYM36_006082 [Artemia franciscana]|uniref:Cyclin-dependent kinase 7 n=2 Tax=Artemia franciscana TaxID=6661 RepID=A0AA88I5Y6_ARTSF|nr:hypothetical protein QYM36_006082 [Artemia franciscana]
MEERQKQYEKIEFLGEGQFATVYKARNLKSDDIVAVKKIKIGSRQEAKDGINRTALREIKLLQELSHPNIIGLVDVFGYKSNISLVFDFMDTDLENIIKDQNIVLTQGHTKAYTLMTLLGLEYLHRNWVLHRDLKPNNLLVNAKGILKIGDFGLGRFFGSPNRVYTNQVVTRWYRAPELLLGAKIYDGGVDIWAVGCILAELLLRVPFLQGDSDLDQLNKIFQCFGTPTDKTWPGHTLLASYIKFTEVSPVPLASIFSAAPDDQLYILSKFLSVNPSNRCTALEALKMPYFSNQPAPTPGDQLPLPGSIAAKKDEERVSTKRKLVDASDG